MDDGRFIVGCPTYGHEQLDIGQTEHSGECEAERIVELAGKKEAKAERGGRIELPCVFGNERLNEVVAP